MKNENQDEFYSNFKIRLDETQEFPSNYLFKFIVLNQDEFVESVKLIFEKSNADFFFHKSKNGKYVSISINLYVIDSESVISYYQKAGKIPNIILL